MWEGVQNAVLCDEDMVVTIANTLPIASQLSAACVNKLLRQLLQPRLAKVWKLMEPPFGFTRLDIQNRLSINLDGREDINASSLSTLADAIEEGALRYCEELHCSRTSIRDDGVVCLCRALSQEGLRRHEGLKHVHLFGLYRNHLGDKGVIALSETLRAGCLPNLNCLLLNCNRLTDVSIAALCKAARGGALRQLEKLCLSANQIGDDGAASLAAAAAEMGAFASIRFLVLERNLLRKRGMQCLAEAIAEHNGFPACSRHMLPSILLMGNPASGLVVEQAIQKRDQTRLVRAGLLGAPRWHLELPRRAHFLR